MYHYGSFRWRNIEKTQELAKGTTTVVLPFHLFLLNFIIFYVILLPNTNLVECKSMLLQLLISTDDYRIFFSCIFMETV